MSDQTTKQTATTNFTNEASREVFEKTYRNGEEGVSAMHRRVAEVMASVEIDKEGYANEFYELLKDFKFVPGGRIMANAGRNFKGTTFLNCYVSGFEGYDRDSMESIMDEMRRQALILKTEGGYGFCVDTLRPRYTYISGIGTDSPGAVKMLDMWDTVSRVITSGSGKASDKKEAKGTIRKGAMMVTMSVWHPDVVEFIKAKQSPGVLRQFNMSVLISDKFMDAVKNNLPWSLVFPDLEYKSGNGFDVKEAYRQKWNGDINAWVAAGYPVRVYQTFENANELWELIAKSTYTRNEPGIIFIDRVNYFNNLYYTEYISASNPCVVEGTLVNTAKGYIKAETVKLNDFICTVLGVEPVEAIEVNEYIDVFKISFSDGGEEIVTAAHQYHARRKGDVNMFYQPIRLDELQIGDLVRVEPTDVLSKTIVEELYNTGAKAGILLGDGCCTENTVQRKIAVNTSELEYIANIKGLFGNDLFIQDSPGEGLSGYIIFKKDAINPEAFGVAPNLSYDKSINYDMANNYSYIIGALDGLLATDGNVNLKSNHSALRFNTTSKQLAQDIRRLLLYIGCYSTISKSFDESGEINGRKIIRKHIKYTVNVSGKSIKNYYAATRIQLLHPDKFNKIKEAVISCGLNGNHGCAKITDIEYVGKRKVYDFYCSGSDTWITSGYVQRGCGEQYLAPGGVCLLGNLNLTQFISTKNLSNWDYEKLASAIPVAVRFMDNVNDITYAPLQVQRDNLKNKRRIGLGVMGYASALLMMKLRYGSERANAITHELMEFIRETAYNSSIDLAIEKGSFPEFDADKYTAGNFIKTLSKKTKDRIKKHGMRNSHLMSIQPTGNTAVLANLVSGGLEPIFLPEYVRTMVIPIWPMELDNITVDFSKKEYQCSGVRNNQFAGGGEWKWITEGDDSMLRCTIVNYKGEHIVYKYDSHRGLMKEVDVIDYGVSFLRSKSEYEPSADYVVNTSNLKMEDHISVMQIFATYVDSAISKTINIQNDYPYEKFKDVYIKAYDSGVIKGCTTYRDGTMANVLAAATAEPEIKDGRPDALIVKTSSPRRPKSLVCDVHHLTVQGEKWLVIVGLYGDGKDPYEVFAFKKNGIQMSKNIKSGTLTKVQRGRYDLDLGDICIEDIKSHFTTNEEEALTRMISTALRHGANIDFIYEQLMKSEGTIVSFSKAVARALKTYVKEIKMQDGDLCPLCNSKLLHTEKCTKCPNCEYELCG